MAQSMSNLLQTSKLVDFVPTTQSTPKPILSRPTPNVSNPPAPVSKPSQTVSRPSPTLTVSKPSPSVSKPSPTVSRSAPTLPVSQPTPTLTRIAPRTNSSPRIEVTLKQSLPQPSLSALGMRRPEPGARRPVPEQGGRKRGSVSTHPVPPKRARVERTETRNKENLTKQELEDANVILPSALLECIINVKQVIQKTIYIIQYTYGLYVKKNIYLNVLNDPSNM